MPSPFASTLYDPDVASCPVVACHLDFIEYEAEMPVHTYCKGQLAIVLCSTVSCRAENNLWIVSPRCAIWIPGGTPHSMSATWSARLNYLFIEPGIAMLPGSCCTLTLSLLIHELVERPTREGADYVADNHAGRLTRVTLNELTAMSVQRLNLPISACPKIQVMTDRLVSRPGDHSTLLVWAKRLALSEHSLARVTLRETGLTFGHWYQQLHLITALQELVSGASVQNVTARLGYGSVNAFATVFKKMMRTTLAHYFTESQTAACQEDPVGPRRLAQHPTRRQGALTFSVA